MCWRLPQPDTNTVFNPVPPRQSDVRVAKNVACLASLLRPFSIAVALPAWAERVLKICSCGLDGRQKQWTLRPRYPGVQRFSGVRDLGGDEFPICPAPPDCRLQLQKNRKPPDPGYARAGKANVLMENGLKGRFPLAEFSARSGIFLCLVISRVESIRKDKEKFSSARKIPSSGKRPLYCTVDLSYSDVKREKPIYALSPWSMQVVLIHFKTNKFHKNIICIVPRGIALNVFPRLTS